MKNNIFGFDYKTNFVEEEVVVEPNKVLPNQLMESFDKKIACFTNKVPLNEAKASGMSPIKRSHTIHFVGGKGTVTVDSYGLKTVIDSANEFDNPKLHGSANQVASHITVGGNTVWKNPKLDESTLSEFAIGSFNNNKIKDATKNAASMSASAYAGLAANARALDKPKVVVSGLGKKVINANNVVKALTVKPIKEMSSDLLSRAAKEANDKINAALDSGKDVLSTVARARRLSRAAKEKKQAETELAKAQHAGYHNESVKLKTDKPDSDLAEFGIKPNLMPGINNIEPIQKPEHSKQDTEQAASATHGPNINQEAMKILYTPDKEYHLVNSANQVISHNGANLQGFSTHGKAIDAMKSFLRLGESTEMKSTTFKYSELIDIFSGDIYESAVAKSWNIEVIKENNIHRYIITDGDDVLAEGTNLMFRATVKNAYLKCVQMENTIIDKVQQPARVIELIKNIAK